MTKRLLQLNGLAILAIVIHHAAAYTLQAMFLLTDRYLPVEVPNFDQMGSPTYYLLIGTRLLLIWAVPAFMFISGYYAGFMAKGQQSMKWNAMLPRVKILLYPFLVWTIIRFTLLRRFPASIDEVLDPYHFVPVLIQFYLLVPWITPLAKKNWRLLLGIFLVIHFAGLGLRYLSNLGVVVPGQELIFTLTPRWFFLSGQPFWFPFGLVFGIHFYNRQQQLVKLKWYFLTSVVFLGALVVGEYVLIDWINGSEWLGPVFSGLAAIPFTLAVILCFLSFSDKVMPLSSELAYIGSRSLGIYMANIPSVYVVGVLMYHLTPWLLGYHIIYMVILIIAGLGGPLLLMNVIRRSPARTRYRYLFG